SLESSASSSCSSRDRSGASASCRAPSTPLRRRRLEAQASGERGASRALEQPHRQRELNVAIAAFVTIDEVLQEKRNVAKLQIAAAPQLMRDLHGRVTAPAPGDVEDNHPDRLRVPSG